MSSLDKEIEDNLIEEHKCPYCEEDFDSDSEKGIHMAEEHMTKDNINRRNQSRMSNKNMLREWKEDKNGGDDESED